MNAVQAKRTAEWRRLLLGLKPERFDITRYGHKRRCDTVACSIGHAGLHPPFIEQGLETRIDYLLGRGAIYLEGRRAYPGSEAAVQFFGLTRYEVERVCYGVQETTPQQIADQLLGILRAHGYDEDGNTKP